MLMVTLPLSAALTYGAYWSIEALNAPGSSRTPAPMRFGSFFTVVCRTDSITLSASNRLPDSITPSRTRLGIVGSVSSAARSVSRLDETAFASAVYFCTRPEIFSTFAFVLVYRSSSVLCLSAWPTIKLMIVPSMKNTINMAMPTNIHTLNVSLLSPAFSRKDGAFEAFALFGSPLCDFTLLIFLLLTC